MISILQFIRVHRRSVRLRAAIAVRGAQEAKQCDQLQNLLDAVTEKLKQSEERCSEVHFFSHLSVLPHFPSNPLCGTLPD